MNIDGKRTATVISPVGAETLYGGRVCACRTRLGVGFVHRCRRWRERALESLHVRVGEWSGTKGRALLSTPQDSPLCFSQGARPASPFPSSVVRQHLPRLAREDKVGEGAGGRSILESPSIAWREAAALRNRGPRRDSGSECGRPGDATPPTCGSTTKAGAKLAPKPSTPRPPG